MRLPAFFLVLMLAACNPADPGSVVMPGSAVVDDAHLQSQVESALLAATDLPGANFVVEVNGGVVAISGSLACETCGGYSTPGGAGNVQMTLGAVVRAVPGVQEVRFQLN
ncbi:MAG: hypothetical protein RLZZ385_1929 [Pseudomonadota bacterium]|jgi:hypothetical protein